MSTGIPKNQLKSQNTIVQAEHEDSADAKRVVVVDPTGIYLGSSPDKPIYVQLSDGSVNIGTVNAEVEMQLSSKDDFPDAGDQHDSIRIGDQNYELSVNSDGSINVNMYEKLFELLANANFLKNANYDRITPSFAPPYAYVSYYQNDAEIAKATFRFVNPMDWDLQLEAFINDDDGSQLLDDDGSYLYLD